MYNAQKGKIDKNTQKDDNSTRQSKSAEAYLVNSCLDYATLHNAFAEY